MSKNLKELYNIFPRQLGGSESDLFNLSNNSIDMIMNKKSIDIFHDDIDSIIISAKITKFFTEELNKEVKEDIIKGLTELNKTIERYGGIKQKQFDELKKKLGDLKTNTTNQILLLNEKINELVKKVKTPPETSKIQDELKEIKKNLIEKNTEIEKL